MARYIIIGAGAVGGGIGARLHQAGAEVVLVARGDHLAALRREGLRLRTPEEDVRLQIPTVGGPAELAPRPEDVLVAATKTQQVPDALAEWADVPVGPSRTAGEVLPLLLATNGVAAETMALRYFARVFGACVWMWAAHLTPGEVIVEGVPTSGVFHIGRFPEGRDENGFLGPLADEWTRARLRTVLPADVMRWKYRKLLTNLGNAVQALVGSQPGKSALVRAAESEGRSVLDAADIAYVSDAEEAAARANGFEVLPVPGLPAFIGGSTWQSLSRSTGNVETDYLNGEIAAAARRIGREAPVNAALARLTRRAAAARQEPGAIDASRLAGLLGLQ